MRTLIVIGGLIVLHAADVARATLVNGGFETPIVVFANGLQTYASIPGWQASDPRGFEVHRFLNNWQPYEGNQYIEATHSVNTFQTIGTIPGQRYVLSYAYSPRPTVLNNPLNVFWDGQLIATHNQSGIDHSNTTWTYFTHEVTASTSMATIEFIAARLDVGTFLDGVQINALAPPQENIPEPVPVTLAIFSIAATVGYVALVSTHRSRCIWISWMI